MAGDFVGRQDDLRKLIELLNGPYHYITIHGVGGIGKTTLALQVVINFTSGKLLGLSLAGIPKPAQVIAKIAWFFHLDIQAFPDLEDQMIEVLQALESENQVLLYLDNMDDVK